MSIEPYIELDYDYEVVELNCIIPNHVHQWCEEKFGKMGSRWFTKDHKIYFRKSADHLLFLLRWIDV